VNDYDREFLLGLPRFPRRYLAGVASLTTLSTTCPRFSAAGFLWFIRWLRASPVVSFPRLFDQARKLLL
jgi:hypothetical protein